LKATRAKLSKHDAPNLKSKQGNPDLSSHVALRIMATSDLHAHLMPHDYYANAKSDRLGLVRTAGLIAKARAESANCLLFDNGDFLQGSPLGAYIAKSRGPTDAKIHPIIAAMNHLRYDACTLGNHEFNYGLEFLEHTLKGASFPVVSANVFRTSGPQAATPFVPPYVILDRMVIDSHGTELPLRIGVIGFTPPQILVWDHWQLVDKLGTEDIVDTAAKYIPLMKSQGADLIIALSHSGIGAPDPLPGMENASTALARIAGIDAIIAGHSHLVFPSGDFAASPYVDPQQGTLCGKPTVMPGFNGSHLGIIDLSLSHENGSYKVRSHQTEVRPIWDNKPIGKGTATVQSDAELAHVIFDAHLETRDWVEKPIGFSSLPLHSFFALVADSPALRLVAAAQIDHVQKTLADTPLATLPVIGSVAPYKAGGRGGPENYTNVPAGDLRLRHAADLYLYPNFSAAIRLTGAQVVDWLEHAAGLFNQIAPGSRDAELINNNFPSFNFEMLFGLNYQIDLSKPPRFDVDGVMINPESHRIVDLHYQGIPIDPAASFVVATNTYRIAANYGAASLANHHVLFRSTESIVDIVQAYIAAKPVGTQGGGPLRRYVTMPGTTVTFDSSPKATAFLADLQDINIEPMHLTRTGFLRFRLHL
jgi:2',3'-cyclic-nucleotide 2'-phosphodiesterase / 3'-nucleotidase